MTTIEWCRPSPSEILVTARGPLDAASRNLLRSIMLRAIALRPERIVVRMFDDRSFDAQSFDAQSFDVTSRAMILSLAKRARLARVALVVDETDRVSR
jgi:hypothetical protein